MQNSRLAERFKLQLHRETRELPIYALVVENVKPRLKRHSGDPETGMPIRPGDNGQTIFRDVPMSRVAWFLSTRAGRSVIDQTGLQGSYDFDLVWDDRPARLERSAESLTTPDDASGPTLFSALREQLGLKLESRKGPVEFLTIRHAEKPTEN